MCTTLALRKLKSLYQQYWGNPKFCRNTTKKNLRTPSPKERFTRTIGNEKWNRRSGKTDSVLHSIMFSLQFFDRLYITVCLFSECENDILMASKIHKAQKSKIISSLLLYCISSTVFNILLGKCLMLQLSVVFFLPQNIFCWKWKCLLLHKVVQ